ncbi:hypothetical protein [Aurantivibrio infirmus]
MRFEETTLLANLLSNGTKVQITRGRLVVLPTSGSQISNSWLRENSDKLIEEILSAVNVLALKYQSYKTGHYGAHKAGGITLQFRDAITLDPYYVIFNANLNRQRKGKKADAGTALPSGQFSVGKQSHFHKFWHSTRLKSPRSLTSYHDYMGKLKDIIFTADVSKGQRLNANSIRPISISHGDILAALNLQNHPDNIRITSGQIPDNSRIRIPDKEILERPKPLGLQKIFTTGHKKYGISKQGSTDIRENVINLNLNNINQQHQSTEEWLRDYSGSQTKPDI